MKLFNWEISGKNIKVNTCTNFKISKKILFGVRACDAYGIAYMDKFFLEGYKDEVYEKNRRHTYVAAINCVRPGENCFCSSMGIGPYAHGGYDILLTQIENCYLIEVGSKKGEELVALGASLFANIDEEILNYKDKALTRLLENLKQKLQLEIFIKCLRKILIIH